MSLEKTFKDADILVTGGCGSIGSEIVKQLLTYDIERVRVFDHDESGQFHLEAGLNNDKRLRPLIGDIRDRMRIKKAMKDVDIVFHAAALKHVPLCEYNPFEAVATNVYGTQNIIDVAREENVKKVICVSTDKAVNPINTMGATKLLSEKLVMNSSLGDYQTLFSCVRFGNVLNSDGSVIPIFKRQIVNGGPVTITSTEMTRFFMSMPDAVKMVLKACSTMNGREIFILKMAGIRITDLAEVLIEKLAPRYGYKPSDIAIKEIGVRPGEKLYELLTTEEEARYVEDNGDMFIIRPSVTLPHVVLEGGPPRKLNIREYSSKSTELLNKSDIEKVLLEQNII